MALQPAAGARDLNPGQVDSNRRLCDLLATVYRLWGYQEVAPPTIERLDTLKAGGAIAERELVRLAADEPLGLRPELTAPIARAASTRMLGRPRPLRLWASGTTFRSFIGDGGGQRISEQLQSGVELLGEPSAAADTELLHLLLAAVATLELSAEHRPTLLVGHHGLLSALLSQVPAEQRSAARHALTDFDPLALAALSLSDSQRQRLMALIGLRGEPVRVLYQLEQWLGPVPLLESLAATLASVQEPAGALGVRVQLDPTYQPHFDLYDGLVFKLVCQGSDAPVAIASGGRYDGLVGRFCRDAAQAAGTGFGFDVEAIRDLLESASTTPAAVEVPGPWLVASATAAGLGAALRRMAELHGGGEAAELCTRPCADQAAAAQLAAERGCRGAVWLAA
ncbi:ATP phosphoribosyltransferase regulatory subunit [Cyanobium gracile UHCC 0139]|uniref:ATP phosphoribosyltransferase regulatory subunit n=1 Tax=Cyanobium gracile UHCC 0139 TaxID=3110308 RepID=A0ABU5RS58_9CYAN|nr:ATP phosphoribosyltransferase regulatory subunit [Cyanobium gracile]MEA5390629.1 ATP phosphoribosyltransferase regulatory subunit [Cyanobium gracile UHCC 0139]